MSFKAPNVYSGENIRDQLEILNFPKDSYLGKGILNFASDLDIFEKVCAVNVDCQQVIDGAEIEDKLESLEPKLTLSKDLFDRRLKYLEGLNQEDVDLEKFPEFLSSTAFFTDMTILSIPKSERDKELKSNRTLWSLIASSYVLAQKLHYTGDNEAWQIDIVEHLNDYFEPRLCLKTVYAKTIELIGLILAGKHVKNCGTVSFATAAVMILATSFPTSVVFSEKEKAQDFVDLVDQCCRCVAYIPVIPRRKQITSPVVIGATVACLCFRAFGKKDKEGGGEAIWPKDDELADFSFSESMAFYLDGITGEKIEKCARELLIPFRKKYGLPVLPHGLLMDYDPLNW